MPRTQTLQLRAPIGGVVRRTSLEDMPTGHLYDSRDFWPIDTLLGGRERLAIRPGFATYNAQATTNLIATLNVAPSEDSQRLLITAAGGNLYKWEDGSPTSVGSGIDTGRNVQAAPYLGAIFVANDTPKRYDHGTTTYGNWTASTDGSIPTGNRLICNWANRMVLAGSTAAPHVWYMSRIGDPYSWLFAEDDDGSPVAATDIEGGQIGEPITSLVPHNRACILFGTANGITVLRGNPAAGGNMERISHVVGPVNPTAWCKTADDWTYFLTRDGLYRMPPGCGVMPQSISREKIPSSLIGLDGIDYKVYMEYDVRFRCIHIYVQHAESQDAYHYFPQYEAFFPVTTPSSTILSIGRYDPIEGVEASGVLIGTSGGLKQLDRDTPLGGSTFAFAKIGPFKMAPLGEKSQIQRAFFKFGDNSDNSTATVDLYAAADAEAVVALPASRKSQATIAALDGYAWHPRISGAAGMAVITQTSTSAHISFEEASLTLLPRGKERG